MKEKKFDIVVYGATGFTGGLVAEYIAENAGLSTKQWAIAGRSQQKLEQVKDKLVAKNHPLEKLELIVASSDDFDALEKMVLQTKIVISTVGPYALYGEKLVKACATNGVHYLDITGEPNFVSDILVNYDALAKQNNALIINCCGFDSIPADIGAFYTRNLFHADEEVTIKAFVTTKGTFSGGTWASAINAMAEGMNQSSKNKTKRKSTLKKGIYYDRDCGKWAVQMPVIDPWMVQRSATLRPELYGSNFEYGQYIGLRKLPHVIGIVGGVGLVYLGAQLKLTRDLLLNFKKSGEGPSEEERNNGFFRLTFYAKSKSKKFKAFISGEKDPGYAETSKMLSESALTVLNHYNDLTIKGGIVTPAGALGHHLIKRLENANIKFGYIEL